MQAAFKYRIYPNNEQKKLFAQTFGCVRFIYNNTLAHKSERYTQQQEKISYNQTAKRLTELKQEFPWLCDVSVVALQQALRNLDTAYSNFFKGHNKYPTFKKRYHKQSFRLTNSGFSVRNGNLYVAKSKSPLRIKWTRELNFTKLNSCAVSMDCSGRYFVSIQGERDVEVKPKSDKAIGLDMGLNHYVITSDGHKYGNPRYYRKLEWKVKSLSKSLSKKFKGSNNRAKAKLKLAKVHAKIADCRKDFLHKLSTKLINENQMISVEDLAIQNMKRNSKLAKSISDAGWGEFLNMLTYKAQWYGRELVTIDRWYPSSKTCSECGHLHASMPLSIRSFECEGCHVSLDRDINAARNILAVGTTVSACGASSGGDQALACSSHGVLKQESSSFRGK